MLDNRAVPRYYGQFREDVLRGKQIVNENIALQMNLIDDLIDDPVYYYDEDAVEGFIAFCEEELTLTDGEDFFMTEPFKLWAEDVYGWYEFEERDVYIPHPEGHGGHFERKRIKRRLRKKQYIIVARGGAKSMYASCIQAYELNCNLATTHQVTTAPTMAQADEVMSPIRTAITRARGPLFSFLTEGSNQNTTGSKANRQKLFPSKKGIENTLTGSLLEVKPMSIDKLQGLRVTVATVDEWLSGDIREDPIGALEQSAAKEQSGASNDNPYLILAISSEGTVRNGPGDDIKMELQKILHQEYYDPHTSIWWYRLDDIDEVGDPDMWIKANPNLGITVTYTTYQNDVARAEANPSVRNDILAKRFGIPVAGYTYFFTYEETLKHKRKRSYRGLPCSMGADLSMGDDFCAFTFLFPNKDDSFGIKSRAYITEKTYWQLPSAKREKYDEFIREGTLFIMDGIALDMNEIYEDLYEFIDQMQYDIRCMGYDPYNADEFVKEWVKDWGEYGVEKVIQGAKTESVPLGELKKYAEERALLFDEDIMEFAMGNAVVESDNNNNKKLMKKRNDEKIDPVSAMLDAYVAYKRHKEDFE